MHPRRVGASIHALPSLVLLLLLVLAPRVGLAAAPPTPGSTHAPTATATAAAADAAPKRGPLAKIADAARSPVARQFAASALKPVPRAFAATVRKAAVGSHGAAKRIEALSDEELSTLPAPDLARLAGPAMRPNLFQRVTPPQRERLSRAFFRVLDSAAADSPGKLDGVLANLRMTREVVPGRYKLDSVGGTARFRALIDENRIPRGDLHAFDQRLADMGMQNAPGSLKLLLDGKQAFGDVHTTMMTALEQAKVTGKPGFVLLSTFAFHSDETGRDVAKDLVALQKAGFTVRVLYDGFGSKQSNGAWSDPKFYEDLKAAGVKLTVVKGSAFALHLSHKKPLQIGYHTAEGAKVVEYNGDMNIGDAYRNDWHGSMSRIEGPATRLGTRAIVEQMKDSGADITPAEEAMYGQFASAQTAKPGMSPIWAIDHRGPADLYNKMTTLSIVDVAPKGGHVFIEQPYVDDPDLFAALTRAAKEGVHVHVIVPAHNNQGSVASATREAYKSLTDAGVHVYEYDGPQFKNPQGFSHLKRIVVLDENGEGLISQDGSTNSDAQSFYHNDEFVHVTTTATIADPAVRAQRSQQIRGITRDVFLRDLKSSRQVGAGDVPKPGFHESVRRLLNRWRILGWLE